MRDWRVVTDTVVSHAWRRLTMDDAKDGGGAPDADALPEHATLDEAFALAMRSHRNGNLPLAERMYRAILAAAPYHVESLHFLGLLTHQAGESEAGIELIRRALALRPTYVDALSNLGHLLRASGRLDEAAETCRRAVAVAPHPQAFNNLGVVLKDEGRYPEAAAALRQAISLDPARGDAHFNLGNVLTLLGRPEEALVEYRRAVELEPGFALAHETLARMLLERGRLDEAREIFGQLLARSPGNPVARHMLAALTGRDVPAQASEGYLEQTFDAFADSFERVLKAIEYRAPELLVAESAAAVAGREGRLDVLDAGCGTGLCAPLLRPLARRLVGVDVSARMLDKASRRKVYDELARAELTVWLREHARSFDLIVGADTLIYFGDLSPVLSAAAAALRDAGVVAFNVEDGGADAGPGGFRLHRHGRYEHDRRYVRRVLLGAGFGDVAIRSDVLRREQGEPVAGLIVLARKP